MPTVYRQFLDALIRHLEDLDARGRRFVSVTPAALAHLRTPARPKPRVTAGRPPGTAAAHPPPRPSPRPQQAATTPAPAAPPVAGLGELLRKPVTPEEKQAAMDALRARVLTCTRCPQLAASRQKVVFGTGNVLSPLLFVGEAPGADEDAQGEPFVGRAGQTLTRMIQAMGLSREEVYIANILKCRPDTPGQSSGNRKPLPTEMATCLPHLLAQIAIIQPRVIVALGNTAIEGLLARPGGGITRLRGHWLEFQGIPLMPTYHPSYLLRNQARSERRKVWEDLLQVMERLGLPISEKQRNYFL
ncbi:MAG TPA: uracil-DNA glycosylase [Verrucomicrobiota bacterium]|nr:uracil-DNA glycosylase [Verrucomicrobiota bacterium]HNU50977.1 uracil-DNA glycosylase [Verrucomicrobiota bacterium]